MGKVIEFPGHGEAGIKMALRYFRETYKKAGLSESEISVAMLELEPLIRQFLVRKEFEFDLHGEFTETQVQLISNAHNECIQEAIKYFSNSLWFALCSIAGLIGRGTLNRSGSG